MIWGEDRLVVKKDEAGTWTVWRDFQAIKCMVPLVTEQSWEAAWSFIHFRAQVLDAVGLR